MASQFVQVNPVYVHTKFEISTLVCYSFGDRRLRLESHGSGRLVATSAKSASAEPFDQRDSSTATTDVSEREREESRDVLIRNGFSHFLFSWDPTFRSLSRFDSLNHSFHSGLSREIYACKRMTSGGSSSTSFRRFLEYKLFTVTFLETGFL